LIDSFITLLEEGQWQEHVSDLRQNLILEDNYHSGKATFLEFARTLESLSDGQRFEASNNDNEGQGQGNHFIGIMDSNIVHCIPCY